MGGVAGGDLPLEAFWAESRQLDISEREDIVGRAVSVDHLEFRIHTSANPRTAARQRRALATTSEVFQALFDRFRPEELEKIAESVQEVIAVPAEETERARFVREFAGARAYSPEERVVLRFETLARAFTLRDELLKDSLTAPEVAQLLRVSRQTPHDRVESGTLLAVLDKGALRFPQWQFDPNGPDGVVAGLPRVVRSLRAMPALAKVNWFVRANPYLEGRRPIDALRQGDVERVLDAAAATGPK